MKNILHLSDIHLSHNASGLSSSSANKVVDALKRDATALTDNIEENIDTIFITGDLAFSGKASDLALVKELIIDELVDHFELKAEQVFLVPGNHDCDRESIKRTEKPFRDKQGFAELDALCQDIQREEEEWPRIANFNEWFSGIVAMPDKADFRSPLTNIYRITHSLYVVGVNSAWLAQDDHDEGKLIIGNAQIKKIKDNVPRNATIILLMHHPIDWLHPEEVSRFSLFVERRVTAVFFGHMHAFKQSLEANFQYDITLRLQAGTLDPRYSNAGYSIISLQKENDFSYGDVYYRKYNKSDSQFEAWTERGEDGAFSFSTTGDLTFDKSKFSSTSRSKLDELNNGLMINLGLTGPLKKDISSLFVDPNISIPDSASLIKRKFEIRSVSEAIQHNGICVAFSGHNEGKSFFLDYILALGLERQAKKNFDKVVLKLDALTTDLGSEGKILERLSSFYFNSDISTSFDKFIRHSINSGGAVILVDNLCKTNNAQRECLFRFAQKYSKCKFVFTCNSTHELEIVKEVAKIDHEDVALIDLSGIKRKNIREMISKWTALSPIGSEKAIYDSLMSVINQSQLPHNNFVYSMLLAIYENEKELSRIFNESDIIENFIEILLRKHNMNTPADKPQYKDLLRFMAFLANFIISEDRHSFTANKLTEIAIDYNRRMLHGFTYEDYYLPLISSGILRKSGEEYFFSQSCFLDYAAAHYMSMDPEFKQFIISDENYLIYNRVIEYFACQNPSNEELLSFVSTRVSELKNDISDLVREKLRIDVNAVDYENINEFSILDIAATSEELEQKLNNIKADRDRNDEIMDEIDPLDSNRNGANSSRKSSDRDLASTIAGSQIKLKEAVSLYGRVHRNMEALIDAEVVMRHFNNIVDSYLYLVKLNIAMMDESILIPLLAPYLDDGFRDDALRINEKQERIDAIRGVIALVRSIVPNMVQAQMTKDLSSKKPRIEQIIRKSAVESEDQLSSAMLKYVLMDLEKFEYTKELGELVNSKSKFVKSTLFFKLFQTLAFDYGLSKRDRESIEKSARKLVAKNREIYRDVSVVKGFGDYMVKGKAILEN